MSNAIQTRRRMVIVDGKKEYLEEPIAIDEKPSSSGRKSRKRGSVPLENQGDGSDEEMQNRAG